jgi:hypothetical protein
MEVTEESSVLLFSPEKYPPLTEGRVLRLVSEPENKFDKFAVRVEHPETNEHLGYLTNRGKTEDIPKGLAFRVGAALKNGTATCFVKRIVEESKTPIHVNLIYETISIESLLDYYNTV